MKRSVAGAALAVAVAVGSVACDSTIDTTSGSSVDRTLFVAGPGSSVYPGEEYACSALMRCADMRAEIERWAAASMDGHGPIAAVTFHRMLDDQGRHLLLTRSGGGTYIAIVTFGDGSAVAVLVGCGIGVDTKACFVNR